MKKVYIITLILLTSCDNSGNSNMEKSNNINDKEVKEQENKESSRSQENFDKGKEISKIESNIVYGKLTLTDQKKDTYYDKTSNTKYILGQDNTFKKIINKSNRNVSPNKFMQKDAEKIDEYSHSVYRYHSKSIDK